MNSAPMAGGLDGMTVIIAEGPSCNFARKAGSLGCVRLKVEAPQ